MRCSLSTVAICVSPRATATRVQRSTAGGVDNGTYERYGQFEATPGRGAFLPRFTILGMMARTSLRSDLLSVTGMGYRTRGSQ